MIGLAKLYICNTSSDCISVVNLDSFEEQSKINLRSDNFAKVGPHGICKYNESFLVANSYENTIALVDVENEKVISKNFIGIHCNDVAECNNDALIICGESNSLVVFNLLTNAIIETIGCENHPHSIAANKEKKIMVIANMGSDSITLIDCENRENIKNIRVGAYPTKALFTLDGKYILVCESNIGSDGKGSVSIISLKNCQLLHRISVGNSPVDMYCDQECCLVSNFGDGTISVISINCYKELRRLNIGGMPRGIVKRGKYIYVGDNYNNLLLQIDVCRENKKVISIGGEPTGMTLV